jgi:pyruvate dehydrogenase E1 component alpha subunit
MEVRQPSERDRAGLARNHGIHALVDDGNNVVAVYRAAAEAVARARSNEGPSYLEFGTYRWREHCGPNYDNDIGYRTPAEFEEWRKKCPIERFRKVLLAEGVVREDELKAAGLRFRQEIDHAFEFARSAPFPGDDELMRGVYA